MKNDEVMEFMRKQRKILLAILGLNVFLAGFIVGLLVVTVLT